ncbi:type II toxin-antitoxin system prevent-host-death family antitoxin [Phragmitibacter flavus]|uniref:Antitoxin n=1 Tax=Phragmitibacter flavus TaxID=2576071 RepID=A0A5R8KFB1_9BACT|nr:type II toxin-antitoxin system prevent-host-death family antitoxin [Phragmitibacter flavus]TLD70972.1 type II toxin-antitoxin system prevent-host-death family antitoxin [Phragmitibacter flavus]
MKTRTVGAYEAKTHFAELLDQVAKGESVQITRRGKLVAELRPPSQSLEKPRPKRGSAEGLILYMAPDFDAPLDIFKDYM